MDNILIVGEQKTDFGHRENNQKTFQDSCSEKETWFTLAKGFGINTYSEIDIFLLRMFSLFCQVVVMWLEKQSSDLQLLSL